MNILVPEDGVLYLIRARNFHLGVYSARDGGFIGIRSKFGRDRLDSEVWSGPDGKQGTATPVRAMEPCPVRPVSEFANWPTHQDDGVLLVNLAMSEYLDGAGKRFPREANDPWSE